MDATAELLETDRRFLVHPLHHPEEHKTPLFVTEGRGAMLHLADGRELIDGLAGLWNVNVGHGRGELADAAAAQMRKIAFASAYVGATNEPAIRLGEKIVRHAYSNSSAVYFTTAGAESNESAFKTARFFWKVQDKPNKTKIISRVHAYHGVTMAAMSATGMAAYHKMFGPLMPGFVHVAAPYAYRWQGNEEPGIGAAEAVEKAILAEGPDTVAAVIAEPVMGAGGVIVPPDSYFPKLREICDKYEVLLIADEVITGFGRTGRWFALGHWGVEPDIVSFAKGVTSGYLPLGGNILSKRVHDAILNAPMDKRYMHAATYSGHPACCAVGLRNVEILEDEGLVERAAVWGRRLLAALDELRNLPNVGDVRGLGMMCGIELVTDKSAKAPALGLGVKVAREAMSRGLLVRARAGGADPAIGDTLCLSPPLSTSDDILEKIPAILRESIIAATKS
ncbi:MAG TPA: aspartate aminotransferase family protein [Stellaceae bacterium]|jgi:adenosylmethionine-8-amino-7-oxononanoate aminotransferase|nr:aspartate aminotransferase family protein [Stellaceae bacterium]